MCLPAVAEFRRQTPNAHVTWVVDNAAADLLSLTGLVDDIVPVSLRRIREGSFFSKIQEVLRCWRRLAFARFDLAFVPFRDPRYRLLLAPARVGGYADPLADGGRMSFVPGRHHSDEYWRHLNHSEGPTVPKVPAARLNLPETESVNALLESDARAPYTVLCVGGERYADGFGALRWWASSHYADLARRLTTEGMSVVVTGTGADQSERAAFAGVPVRDLIGRLSLRQFCEVLARAQAVVSHDGGALHLAGLMGTPTVALFGPTSPSERAPRHDGCVELWGGEHLSCRPCYDGRTFALCQHNLCMEDISVQRVYHALLTLRSRDRGGTPPVGGLSHIAQTH